MQNINKKNVASYLETRCDRQLFLSLMNQGGDKNLSKDRRDELKIPSPYKIRTRGLAITRKQGVELEASYYDILKDQFSKYVTNVHEENNKNQSKAERAFLKACQDGLPLNHFFLEASFSTSDFMKQFYKLLKITEEDINVIPTLKTLRPDIILTTKLTFFNEEETLYEVLPDGDIKDINREDERTLLTIVDVKLAEDASIGQYAEVALYAWMLSNWLSHHNLSENYIVVDQVGIWTKKTYKDMSKKKNYTFSSIDHMGKLNEWYGEISTTTFDQYMLSIRGFFKQDLSRVLRDEYKWQELEYHLTPNCDVCDFLGRLDQDVSQYVDHESKEVKYPYYEEYCAQKALIDRHNSRVPGMTKGACRSLVNDGVLSLSDLYICDTSVFNQHSELKKQKHRIVEKAKAVEERKDPSFFESKNISLAKYPNLGVMFHINYDMSNGQAASFAVQGACFPWTKKYDSAAIKKPHFFEQRVFIVESLNEDEELKQLELFLSYIEEMINYACDKKNNPDPDFDITKMSARPSVQFYCWDRYQLEFMRNILSRHIQILLDQKYSKALLWLFSPDELLQNPDYYKHTRGQSKKLMAPYICVLKDIVQEQGKFPVETAYPLLVIASCVDDIFKKVYKKTSWMYKPQLGDYIPRERILEIWMDVIAKKDIDYVKKYEPDMPDAEIRDAVIDCYKRQYISASSKQIWAVSLLRKHIANESNIEKTAYAPPVILETILDRDGIKRLPVDSQLWWLFTLLDDQINLIEYQQEVVSNITQLESRYACIVVTKKIEDKEYQNLNIKKKAYTEYYYVTEDSKNSKIRDGDGFLTLLLQNYDGFSLMRPCDILRTHGDQAVFDKYERKFPTKVYSRFQDLISVNIKDFDRIRGWIGISYYCDIVNELMQDGLLVINENIVIARSKPLNRHHIVEQFLKQIKHPVIASPSQEAQQALLKDTAEKSISTHAITRAAEILWQADILHTQLREFDEKLLKEALEWVHQASGRFLPNPSQENAVASSLKRNLNVIWGPPGTGKTDTAVNILGVQLYQCIQSSIGKRILITGPTKRAVIEILERFKQVLTEVPKDRLSVITLSGSSSTDYDFILDNKDGWEKIENKAVCHGVKDVNGVNQLANVFKHLSDVRDFIVDSKDSDKIVIVATHHHSLYPLMTGITVKGKAIDASGLAMAEMFDYALIDECSQIDVPDSLSILNTLDRDAQSTWIGDHFQMQPIQRAKTPKGAEYLLKSIQGYLLTRFRFEPDPLLENYRSNKAIVEFGHRIGYPKTLTAVDESQVLEVHAGKVRSHAQYHEKLEDIQAEELFVPSNPVVTIRYDDGMSGQANPFETKVTINLILSYYEKAVEPKLVNESFNEHFWRKMVGVVTPHKAQRALIVQELFKIFPENVHPLIDQAVDTVERFQGGERNMIIISYGVGDEDIIRQEEEFLINLNRTNVSISRAKQQAVLIMSNELLRHLTNDDDLVQHAKALKRYDHYCKYDKSIDMPWNGKLKSINYSWRI